MPPQSRGEVNGGGVGVVMKPPPLPTGLQSKSTPNLPTRRTFQPLSTTETDNRGKDGKSEQKPPGEIVRAPIANLAPLDTTHEPASSDEEDDEDDTDEDDGDETESTHTRPKLPSRPHSIHHSSRSYNNLNPQAFAPPFYGRPPTPLPPSPSLTSLLRPSFHSRPTTPDPSSDEGISTLNTRDHTGTQTPTSAAASTLTSTYRAHATNKPIPRASPKVPTYEYYGFTLYLTSSLVFVVYIFWAFLPSPFLHQLGIYYYLDRWWALAIPAWTVMAVVWIYVALGSYNTQYLTLPLHDVGCLVDEAAEVAVVDGEGRLVFQGTPSWYERGLEKSGGKGRKEKGGKKKSEGRAGRQDNLMIQQADAAVRKELDWRSMWNEGTDAVMDIPIGGVCEILYGLHADDTPDDD